MDAAELKRWLASVARLTPAQKADLLKALSARDDEAEVGHLVESRLAQSRACPHCASMWIVCNGSASGLQRFKCRACHRTFNVLSKTPLARLRKKAKWLQQEDALGRGLIVRLASAELGVAPSTAFRWRHRFLQLTQAVNALVLTGMVEADETFFLRSSKGQRPGRAPRKRGAPVPSHAETGLGARGLMASSFNAQRAQKLAHDREMLRIVRTYAKVT
jgi:transposase-like protein